MTEPLSRTQRTIKCFDQQPTDVSIHMTEVVNGYI